MKRTRLRRMSQQRKLRKSGQRNRKTREMRPQEPVEKCFQTRRKQCRPETSHDPKSSQACKAPAILTTLLAYHSLLAHYLPDCIFLQMSHVSSHFRAFALPAADTLLSFSNSGSFSTSQLRGYLFSEAFSDYLLQIALLPGDLLSHLPVVFFFRAFLMIQNHLVYVYLFAYYPNRLQNIGCTGARTLLLQFPAASPALKY